MAWVRARLCKLQKRVHSTRSHQLLAHGQLFSPGIPASSTTKTGRHDIAESGAKHQKSNQIKLSYLCSLRTSIIIFLETQVIIKQLLLYLHKSDENCFCDTDNPTRPIQGKVGNTFFFSYLPTLIWPILVFWILSRFCIRINGKIFMVD